ncbi:MAG: YebC/PmpR family DNA-binding transcriptional regulator, partial [Candidatus Peregrinibacteria bacterium]
IKKGSGELKGEQMAVETYAAYGPGNVAMVIECLTDNKNRTLGSVRSILERRGARWADSGSVLWMFQQKGIVVGRRSAALLARPASSHDELELKLIDAGAEELEWADDSVEVVTDATRWPKVRDLLKAEGFSITTAGLKFVPSQKVAIADLATAQHLMNLIEAIEEDEDVSEVHTNAEIADEVAAQL